MDYGTLEALRQNHPAWRLLKAEHAPLIASFLHRVFIATNVRHVPQSTLVEALEDQLFVLNEGAVKSLYSRPAQEYLNDWAGNDKGWLRKFYIEGSDEPHFDLTPSTEKAISWLSGLTERIFVGTESRLLLLFDLLKQMCEGTDTDQERRVLELRQRRDELDAEIARVESGDLTLLNDASIRDRFQQFTSIARELLSDFRQVEQNFRQLDRKAREQIATWDGSRGELLHELMGERDRISDSDEGASFKAFWQFLMSEKRQTAFTEMLVRVLQLPAVADTSHNERLKTIHYDWMDAGDHTQRTIAQLSQQLRRFLDDAARLENRRIMEILRGIESSALKLRGLKIDEVFTFIDLPQADIELPMERPLYTPRIKAKITARAVEADASDIDPAVLFSQLVVNSAELKRHIKKSLQSRSQISLTELIEQRPLEHGLAEVVVYLQLATDTFESIIDDNNEDVLTWPSDNAIREARLPRVIFVREQ